MEKPKKNRLNRFDFRLPKRSRSRPKLSAPAPDQILNRLQLNKKTQLRSVGSGPGSATLVAIPVIVKTKFLSIFLLKCYKIPVLCFHKDEYFFCSLSVPRFYSIHSDSACPQSLTLRYAGFEPGTRKVFYSVILMIRFSVLVLFLVNTC